MIVSNERNSNSDSVDKVPAALRDLDHWVLWREVQRDGQATKLPFQPDGTPAKSNDPATWHTLDACMAVADQYNGPGFVFAADGGFTGIDLDGCRNPETGEIVPWAMQIIQRLDSYSEVSPSGTGVKIWIRGMSPLPRGKKKAVPNAPRVSNKVPGIEVYSHGRYFAVTGWRLDGVSNAVESRQTELKALCNEHWPEPEPEPMQADRQGQASTTDDEAKVIERARAYIAKIPGAISGQDGHDTTYHVACVLVKGFGLREPDALALMHEWNRTCQPPWTASELEHKIADATQEPGPVGYLRDAQPNEWSRVQVPEYKSPDPGSSSQVSITLDATAQTDLGNAERFVKLHGQAVLWCEVWKCWLCWDGKRWARDEMRRVEVLAKLTVRQMLREAADTTSDSQRQALVSHQRKSESAARLAAMLELAKSHLPAHPNDFDADSWLFNVANGTIDLHTGQLQPHSRGDMITKLSPVCYDPDAALPEWEWFLQDATREDTDVRHLMQRAAGMSLCGDIRDHALFICHGPGGTGKSTFAGALRGIFGDYGRVADFSTFTRTRDTRGPRDDLAELAGARYVCSIEVSEAGRLAESVVKSLTGGDTVRARFLYSRSFEFTPQFTLWMFVNDAPRVSAQDSGSWRRIVRIPFEFVVPKSKCDPTLAAMLRDPEVGGPAVLAWAVRGCLDWQAHGLAIPGVIQAATDEYRADCDTVAGFASERCVFDEGAIVSAGELWHAYQDWCADSGEQPVSRTAFTTGMKGLGARPEGDAIWYRGRTQRVWRGVGLQSCQHGENLTA